jgi:hypothetical protein
MTTRISNFTVAQLLGHQYSVLYGSGNQSCSSATEIGQQVFSAPQAWRSGRFLALIKRKFYSCSSRPVSITRARDLATWCWDPQLLDNHLPIIVAALSKA